MAPWFADSSSLFVALRGRAISADDVAVMLSGDNDRPATGGSVTAAPETERDDVYQVVQMSLATHQDSMSDAHLCPVVPATTAGNLLSRLACPDKAYLPSTVYDSTRLLTIEFSCARRRLRPPREDDLGHRYVQPGRD